LDLGLVDAEETQELVIVLQGAEVHEHGPAGVGAVGDMDGRLCLCAAVELVDEPRVDRAKGETALLVCLLDRVDVLKEPQQLDTARVCG
jgi:hypothetical protein